MEEKGITAQERMWKVMRGLRRFTTEDIVQLAEVSWNFANRYCRALRYIGYLREDGRQKLTPGRGKKQIVYRLVKDTGPKAPTIRAVCEVRDPNTGEKFCTEESF